MAFDFPNSPTTGQTVTGPGNIQWLWDGAKWTVVGSSSWPPGYAMSVFTSSGTYTTPANSTIATVYRFRMVGGGGGGGGTGSPSPTFGGGGGGGGESVEGTFSGVPPNTAIPITIGAGGNGGSTAGGNGGAGGATTIGAPVNCVANNGGGGNGAVGSTAAFAGQGGSGGANGSATSVWRIAGTLGGEGIQPSNGQMVYGPPGGTSMMGNASYGVAYGFGATGSNGVGYGSGGGGAISTAYAGGAGTPGIVIIEPQGPVSSVGYVAPGRNLFHNPYFNIQQRGTGPWTGTTYTADRWPISIVNDTVSASMVTLADPDRTAIGDEAAVYALQIQFTGSATAGSYSQLYPRIEGVRRVSGKTITVSFWAHATSGNPKLGLGVYQLFGSGGSPSANVYTVLGATPNLSTTWQRYSITGTLPSAAGKTFGTTLGTDITQFSIFMSDQGNTSGNGIGVQSGTVQFWGMQLEIGNVATALEKLDPRQDLANCQRFYAVQAGYLYGFALNATELVVLWTFPVPMRVGPNVTLLTTTPYSEQPPFAGAHGGSGATLPNNHAGSNTGFDIHIAGFSGFTVGAVASLGPNCLAASADL